MPGRPSCAPRCSSDVGSLLDVNQSRRQEGRPEVDDPGQWQIQGEGEQMPGVPAMVRIPGSAHSKDPKRWSLPGWRHRRHRQQNRHHQQRHQNRLHQHHRLHQRHRHQYWLRQGPKIKIVRFWGISRIYAHAITCKISPPQTFWGISSTLP